MNLVGNITYDLAIDTEGSVYMAGRFNSNTLTFGDITLTKTTTYMHGSNMFVVKYDSDGNALWADSTGSTFENNTHANTVVTDHLNNVYVSGFFSNTISFGDHQLHAGGGSNMFTVKYDSSGIPLWATKPWNTNGYNSVQNSDVDSYGNLYITGTYYNSQLDFGNNIVLTDNGQGSLFVVRYNADGTTAWGRKAGNLNVNNAVTIDVKAPNEIYVSGTFSGNTITFGTTTLTKSTNNYDMFLAKLYGAPLATENFASLNVTVYPNPATDALTIDNLSENFGYGLYDISGKQVKNGTLSNLSNRIAVDDLTGGIYFLTLENNLGMKATEKIVVK